MNYYPKINVAEVLIESGKIVENDDIMFQGVTTGVIEQTVKGFKSHKEKNKLIITLKTDKKVRMNDKMYKITGRKS